MSLLGNHYDWQHIDGPDARCHLRIPRLADHGPSSPLNKASLLGYQRELRLVRERVAGSGLWV
jgi:hypothetical protein